MKSLLKSSYNVLLGTDYHISNRMRTLPHSKRQSKHEPEVYPPRNEVPNEIILGELYRVAEDRDKP
jgi:hypothetical protein